MFLGSVVYPPVLEYVLLYLLDVLAILGCFTLALQLAPLTLVAVVDTLLELPLLYRVKALVDVPALLAVLIILLLQLFDTIELALDATGLPLRALLGEMPRSDRRSGRRSTLVWDREVRARAGDWLL